GRYEQVVFHTEHAGDVPGYADGLFSLGRRIDGPGERDDLGFGVDVDVERVQAVARQRAFDLCRDPGVLAAGAGFVGRVLKAVARLVGEVDGSVADIFGRLLRRFGHPSHVVAYDAPGRPRRAGGRAFG